MKSLSNEAITRLSRIVAQEDPANIGTTYVTKFGDEYVFDLPGDANYIVINVSEEDGEPSVISKHSVIQAAQRSLNKIYKTYPDSKFEIAQKKDGSMIW